MFLKRKVSTASNRKNNNTSVDDINKSNSNWSEACVVYIKDFVLKRRTSSKANKKSIALQSDSMLIADTNLCFDQLSEFQRSYISFPEFNDSTISDGADSECSSNAQDSWRLTTSSSFSSYTSSHI